jgi:2-oxoglutarate ferredoxin oxidoreductase subunit alpha
VPAVIVNVMRGGPGLGNVQPAQGDYLQAVKMAGHGDFHPIVLAPDNVQEAIDCTVLAFDLAEKYRTIAMVVIDGAIGQMMEPAELPPMQPVRPPEERPPWALTGAQGRPPQTITSLYLGGEVLEEVNLRLQAKLKEIAENEVRWQEYHTQDAELLLVAFGTMGRVCQTAVREAREGGLKVGLLRPVSLWPFPGARLVELTEQVHGMLVVEMNAGQMVEDVRLAVEGRCPVRFYGRMGGVVPLPDDVLAVLRDVDAELAGPARGRKGGIT